MRQKKMKIGNKEYFLSKTFSYVAKKNKKKRIDKKDNVFY